jgi:hypothetical protein
MSKLYTTVYNFDSVIDIAILVSYYVKLVFSETFEFKLGIDIM